MSSGSSASTVPTPARTASTSARRRWTSARARRPVIQRLVPSAAATGRRGWRRTSRSRRAGRAAGGQPRARAAARGLGRRARRPRPRRRRARSGRAAAGRARSGRRRRRRPGRSRPRAAPRCTARCGRCGSQGSRVTTAVAPRARSPAPAQRDDLGVRSARRPRASPRRRSAGRVQRRPQPTRGLGLVVAGPRAASAIARRIASCSLRAGHSAASVLSGVPRTRAPGDRVRRGHGTAARPPRRALPPIRTLTVGPGVPPGQPADGFGRVADCHRRFGISPTPEHACRVAVQSRTRGVPQRVRRRGRAHRR